MGAGLTGFIWSKMGSVFGRSGLCEGKGITMEEEIGKTAGAIWDVLNTKGELSLSELKKAVRGKEPTFDWALSSLSGASSEGSQRSGCMRLPAHGSAPVLRPQR